MVLTGASAKPSVAEFLGGGLGPEYDVRASTEAVSVAEAAAARAKPSAAIRNRFLARARASDPVPPAARLLRAGRGGRGGDVRFRLMVSMLWIVRDDPELSYPARAWAGLLGLPDPDGRGARRIKDALQSLHEIGLVHVRRSTGRDTFVELRDDAGDGARYELPGRAYVRLKKDNPAQAQRHRYFQLPPQLWTQGWMSILSGSAVAMLLVIAHELSLSRDSDNTFWLSPGLADARYALSEDTRSKGLLQLEQADLVTVERKPVAPDSFDYRRVRNLLTWHPSVLTDRPAALQSEATRTELRRHRRASFDDVADEPRKMT